MVVGTIVARFFWQTTNAPNHLAVPNCMSVQQNVHVSLLIHLTVVQGLHTSPLCERT